MKRIISIIIVVCISVVFFSLPAYATSNGGQYLGGGGNGGTRSDYGNSLSAYLNALNEYSNGNISYEEFCSRTSNIATDVEVETLNRLGFKHTEDISRSIYKAHNDFGANASIYLHDWLQQLLNGYTKTEQQSTTDTKGYGAMVKISDDYGRYYIFYCEYAEIDLDNKKIIIHNFSHRANFEYGYLREWDENGTWSFDIDSTASYIPKFVGNVDPGYLEYYGDVRYSDGSKAPTNDEFTDISVIDFDTHEDGTPVTDKELEDLLKDIVESLENEMPDLSGTDEILKAIYYRLGNLDSDDDGPLLSQLLDKLSEKSESVKIDEFIENFKEDQDLKDFRNKILEYISPGDVTKAQEFMINVQGLFYSKFSFIDEFKSFLSDLSWDTPDSISIDFDYMGNTYSVDTAALDSYMPVFRGMLAFFIYVSFAVRSFKRMPFIISGGGDE